MRGSSCYCVVLLRTHQKLISSCYRYGSLGNMSDGEVKLLPLCFFEEQIRCRDQTVIGKIFGFCILVRFVTGVVL